MSGTRGIQRTIGDFVLDRPFLSMAVWTVLGSGLYVVFSRLLGRFALLDELTAWYSKRGHSQSDARPLILAVPFLLFVSVRLFALPAVLATIRYSEESRVFIEGLLSGEDSEQLPSEGRRAAVLTMVLAGLDAVLLVLAADTLNALAPTLLRPDYLVIGINWGVGARVAACVVFLSVWAGNYLAVANRMMAEEETTCFLWGSEVVIYLPMVLGLVMSSPHNPFVLHVVFALCMSKLILAYVSFLAVKSSQMLRHLYGMLLRSFNRHR